ncbi:pirin family protein, partial [Vibrio vulnificus]
MAKVRALKQIRESIATKDGDGVNITRLAGFECPDFSPFLMIDELKSEDSADYIGGFPPHPHRGIETLTYMLNGHFQHKDHMGNVG